jgi:hypothetical protein
VCACRHTRGGKAELPDLSTFQHGLFFNKYLIQLGFSFAIKLRPKPGRIMFVGT